MQGIHLPHRSETYNPKASSVLPGTQRDPAVRSKATNLPWKESNTQTRELDRATIAVANTTDITGTATADEFNRGLGTGKERRVGRTGLPGLVSLMAAGIFVALALMPARADDYAVFSWCIHCERLPSGVITTR